MALASLPSTSWVSPAMHCGLILLQVLLGVSFIDTVQIANAGLLNLKPRDVDDQLLAAVPVNNYSYTGVTGPLGWTGLDPRYVACSTSPIQSPINLDKSIKSPPSNPIFRFGRMERGEFGNLGTTVEVSPRGTRGTLVFERKEYILQQFHFHTPSEHHIELEYYSLEVHFVYKAADNASLVLGVLFELTTDRSTTTLLTVLAASLDEISKPGSATETGPLNLQPIHRFLQRTPLFYYIGSLTAPPCTEGLIWLVPKKTLPLNVETFLKFKNVLKFNARYTQNVPGHKNLIKVAAGDLPK